MAYWLEIHCDIHLSTPFNGETRPLFSGDDSSAVCFTDRNDNVSGFVNSVRGLNKKAKEQGWIVDESGDWICPGCQKELRIRKRRNRNDL